MKTKLGVEFEIDFAHTLKGHPKCGQPHGHTSKIIVEVEGIVPKGDTYQENMLVDFADMKKTCWSIIGQLDHKDLDTMFDFPTSENIAAWIFENLEEKIPLSSVRFFEGSSSYCLVSK